MGRTGLKVGVAGLGCGGHSRLGVAHGASPEQAERVVRTALDLGVDLIDTAESYGTETIVGRAVRDVPRERIVLSTKVGPRGEGGLASPEDYRRRIEGCLERLGVDYLDIFHFHGVEARDYPYCVDALLPVVRRMREEGKIRFVGITEAFGRDPAHEMLEAALSGGLWDVVMIGFNFLNPSARKKLFPLVERYDVGTLDMFAIRRALTSEDRFRALFAELAAAGTIAEEPSAEAILAAVRTAGTLPEVAYRFCLHEPAIDCVLTGTGSEEHLRQNVESLQGPDLPDSVRAILENAFGHVESVTGN